MERNNFKSNKIDPNVGRKDKLIKKNKSAFFGKKDFLPSIIEFSSSGLCNRKCPFCPRSAPDYDHINQHISLKHIEKITDELSVYKKDFFFIFSGFAEPLLTKNLEEIIQIIRNKLQTSTIEINTNTDLLTIKRIKSLFESGLSSIRCSIYDDERRLKEVEKMLKECNIEESSYSLRPRFYKKEKDGDKALDNFGINLSNRAGMMENALYSIPALKEPLKNPCYYPFYNIFMDFNGDYLLCPHDWGKGEVLGHVDNCHIVDDIWLSERSNVIRKNLLESKRCISEACKKCDVVGTYMGLEEANQWKKLWNS